MHTDYTELTDTNGQKLCLSGPTKNTKKGLRIYIAFYLSDGMALEIR